MTTERVSVTIGKTVAALRASRGIDQYELARRLNTHQSTVSRLERGEQQWTAEHMANFASALGVPMRTLLPDEPPMPRGLLLSESETDLVLAVRRGDEVGSVRKAMDGARGALREARHAR